MLSRKIGYKSGPNGLEQGRSELAIYRWTRGWAWRMKPSPRMAKDLAHRAKSPEMNQNQEAVGAVKSSAKDPDPAETQRVSLVRGEQVI